MFSLQARPDAITECSGGRRQAGFNERAEAPGEAERHRGHSHDFGHTPKMRPHKLYAPINKVNNPMTTAAIEKMRSLQTGWNPVIRPFGSSVLGEPLYVFFRASRPRVSRTVSCQSYQEQSDHDQKNGVSNRLFDPTSFGFSPAIDQSPTHTKTVSPPVVRLLSRVLKTRRIVILAIVS